MVSRIRYPHILNQYLRGKKPFSYFIRVLLLLAFLIWNIQLAMALIFCGFAANSFVKWFFHRVISKKHKIATVAHSELTNNNTNHIVDGDELGQGTA